jgi:hypothetical protein
MKTIICGGRDYEFTFDDWKWLDGLRLTLPITEVVSGKQSQYDHARSAGSWAQIIMAKNGRRKTESTSRDFRPNGITSVDLPGRDGIKRWPITPTPELLSPVAPAPRTWSGARKKKVCA